jgi:hypothetical protein
MLFAGFAFLLGYSVVAHSFAAYFAAVAPRVALWLDPQQPVALISLADEGLSDAARLSAQDSKQRSGSSEGRSDSAETVADTYQSLIQGFSAFELIGESRSVTRPLLPKNAATVRGWAETALTNDPLNAHALRILGELADASGDDPSADKFMQAAAYLSRHESAADLWMLRKTTQARDFKSALYYADVALRTAPELGTYVVPVLVHMAESGGSTDLLTNVLAADPPWRRQFFGELPQSVTDARTPLALLTTLQASANPPTRPEIHHYVEFLVAHKFYDLAYYTWLQFLPPEQLASTGLLFNGSFEVTPSGEPFDWTINAGPGVTIDIVPQADGNGGRALLVDFQFGRVDYHSVSELVMLTPGTYAFKGQYKGKLDGPRGLKWRVVCAGGGSAPIGEGPMMTGLTRNWSGVDFTFTVPETDCRAQYVRLDLDARMASEQMISGSMLFKEVHISRVANEQPAEQQQQQQPAPPPPQKQQEQPPPPPPLPPQKPQARQRPTGLRL